MLNPSVEINTNDLLESWGGMTSLHGSASETEEIKKGAKLANTHIARKEVQQLFFLSCFMFFCIWGNANLLRFLSPQLTAGLLTHDKREEVKGGRGSGSVTVGALSSNLKFWGRDLFSSCPLQPLSGIRADTLPLPITVRALCISEQHISPSVHDAEGEATHLPWMPVILQDWWCISGMESFQAHFRSTWYAHKTLLQTMQKQSGLDFSQVGNFLNWLETYYCYETATNGICLNVRLSEMTNFTLDLTLISNQTEANELKGLKWKQPQPPHVHAHSHRSQTNSQQGFARALVHRCKH